MLECIALSSGEQRWRRRGLQQGSAKSETFPTTAVSKEAEVADLDETRWQNVKQETPNKLNCVYRHNLLLVAVGGVSPTESHLAASEFKQSTI
jgi:hypothetical protein